MIKEALLAEFDHEIATTRRLLERLPDDRLAWKPHEKSMSLGRLAQHVATLPMWAGSILEQPSFDLEGVPPGLPEPQSRDEVLKLFEGATTATRALIDRTDAEYMAPWTLKRSGQEMFTLPRLAAFRAFVLSHIIHHRGQLSVYLRLNDVPVPPIYGPSADEG
jgi:uncharacterized damage-inducible protein DinB